MTAKQWMLKQKNQRILEKMTEPGVCIKDAVEELGFDSQSNFNRHCKLYFGCTAKQLMERCQTENSPIYEDKMCIRDRSFPLFTLLHDKRAILVEYKHIDTIHLSRKSIGELHVIVIPETNI